MLRQYHPFSLHRPAHLTKSGRPEGVLQIGTLTRHNGRLWMVVGFKLREVQTASRLLLRDGSTTCQWETRYYAHGMYEVLIQQLGGQAQKVVSDIQMLADYRNDVIHHPRPNNRRMRKHMMEKTSPATASNSPHLAAKNIKIAA